MNSYQIQRFEFAKAYDWQLDVKSAQLLLSDKAFDTQEEEVNESLDQRTLKPTVQVCKCRTTARVVVSKQ